MRIRPMRPEDAEQVLAIYALGIAEGNATFETQPPGWDEFDAAKLPEHRFVAEADGDGDGDAGGGVLGWTAVSRVSARSAYAGVVEHSVYVHPDARGRGVARALLERLLLSTDASGIWTVQSGIFPENTASIALHRTLGFREIGVRERVGRLHGVWRDVVLVERRSPVVD